MNEVFPNLFVGDVTDALNCPDDIVNINVAIEHTEILTKAIDVIWYIPVSGLAVVVKGNADTAAEIIDRELKAGRKVLVNCNMGMERAPLTVVWFLMTKRGFTRESAYERVKKGRPQTQERDWFWLKK